MRNLFLNIVITLIVAASCFYFLSKTKNNPDYESVQNTEPIDVSIIRLVANSEKYHNKLIRVIGFVHLQFEGNAICPYEEDYKRLLIRNCLWISVSDEIRKQGSIDKYMIVEGIFDAKSFGHYGMYSGTLRKIKRFDNWMGNRNREN